MLVGKGLEASYVSDGWISLMVPWQSSVCNLSRSGKVLVTDNNGRLLGWMSAPCQYSKNNDDDDDINSGFEVKLSYFFD